MGVVCPPFHPKTCAFLRCFLSLNLYWCRAGQHVFWHTNRPGVANLANKHRMRSLHPGVWLTNGVEIAWIKKLDTTNVRCLHDGTLLLLEDSKKRVRKTIEGANELLEEKEDAVFAPIVRVGFCHWASISDWLQERRMRVRTVDIERFDGWDFFLLNIHLGGKRFPVRPWQVANPLRGLNC